MQNLPLLQTQAGSWLSTHNMSPFKLGPKFYISFVLVTLFPTVWVARLLEDALRYSPFDFIKSLVELRIIEAPTTVVLIGFLFWAYETSLWRLWPFHYLHKTPYIAGRYKGEIESSYQGGTKYPIILEIRQTLSSVAVCLYAEKSPSFSVLAEIGTNEHGNDFLAYAYKNSPRTVSNDLDMRTHDGFASLEIFTKENKLEGFYYNNPRERPTHGKLSCHLMSRERKGHF